MTEPKPAARRVVLGAIADKRRQASLMERVGMLSPEEVAEAEAKAARKKRLADQVADLTGR